MHLLREVLYQLQEVRENTINTEKTSYKYGLGRLEQKLIIFNTLSTFYTYHNLTDYYHFILNLAGISLVNEHSMASYLVTGSSRGLGLAMVTHLANSSPSDARVVFATARSQTPGLKELVEKSSGRVVFVEMDTTDQASVDKAVKVVEFQLGDKGLDYLVNNAGVGGFAPEWTEKL